MKIYTFNQDGAIYIKETRSLLILRHLFVTIQELLDKCRDRNGETKIERLNWKTRQMM